MLIHWTLKFSPVFDAAFLKKKTSLVSDRTTVIHNIFTYAIHFYHDSLWKKGLWSPQTSQTHLSLTSSWMSVTQLASEQWFNLMTNFKRILNRGVFPISASKNILHQFQLHWKGVVIYHTKLEIADNNMYSH